MSEELHIASFIVQARPNAIAAVVAEVRALRYAEIAAREGGKLIVLVEAPGSGAVMEVVDALRALPGVLAVNLVYHHAEARESMLEETFHGHSA